MKPANLYLKATRSDGFRREGLYARVDLETISSRKIWVLAYREKARFPEEFICENADVKFLSDEEKKEYEKTVKKV